MVNFILCEFYLKKKKKHIHTPFVGVKGFYSLRELLKAYSTEGDKDETKHTHL